MKDYTIPKLYKGKKEWYVYFRYKFYNTITEKWQWKLFKHRQGLSVENLKDRERTAKILCGELLKLLKEGFNPIEGVHGEESEIVQLKQTELLPLLRNMLAIKKENIRVRSYQSYKYSIDVFEKYLVAHNMQFIKSKGYGDAMMFADWMIKDMKYKGKTFNGMVTFMRTMFNMLVERQVIIKNPFAKIKRVPEDVGKNIAFSEEQKQTIKKYLLEHNPNLFLFCKFIYHCFYRPSELLGAQVGDIHLQDRTIIIWGGISKNRKQLPATIPDSFLIELEELNFSRHKAEHLLFGKNLLVGSEPIHRNTVSRWHSEVLKELEIPNEHTMYSWRHTGVCDAYRAGVPFLDIMRQLRHHSAEQTLTYFKSMGLQPNTGFQTKAPAL